MWEGSLMQLMSDGGWVMWVLLLFSGATVAVALQRVAVLGRAGGSAAPALRRLRKLLAAGRPRRAAAEELAADGSSVGTLLAAGLSRSEGSREELEGHLESVALRELRRLNRGLAVLAAVATTAPLLGFLGTVTGMIDSFGTLVEVSLSRPDLVARGIKEALTTTAGGLMVAVPAQLLLQWLRARIERIEGELEAAANGLLDLVRRRERGVAAP